MSAARWYSACMWHDLAHRFRALVARAAVRSIEEHISFPFAPTGAGGVRGIARRSGDSEWIGYEGCHVIGRPADSPVLRWGTGSAGDVRTGAQARRSVICWREIPPTYRGPVAQLGARFHGMEEVESSNLSRSTTSFQQFTASLPS